jgi:hypothetical protein
VPRRGVDQRAGQALPPRVRMRFHVLESRDAACRDEYAELSAQPLAAERAEPRAVAVFGQPPPRGHPQPDELLVGRAAREAGRTERGGLAPVPVGGEGPVVRIAVNVRRDANRRGGKYRVDGAAQASREELIGGYLAGRGDVDAKRDVVGMGELPAEERRPVPHCPGPWRLAQQDEVAPPEARIRRAAHHHAVRVLGDLAAFQRPQRDVGPVARRCQAHRTRIVRGRAPVPAPRSRHAGRSRSKRTKVL